MPRSPEYSNFVAAAKRVLEKSLKTKGNYSAIYLGNVEKHEQTLRARILGYVGSRALALHTVRLWRTVRSYFILPSCFFNSSTISRWLSITFHYYELATPPVIYLQPSVFSAEGGPCSAASMSRRSATSSSAVRRTCLASTVENAGEHGGNGRALRSRKNRAREWST